MGRTSTSGQGRPKGVPNKATAERQRAAAARAAAGITPLDFLLSVMADKSNDLPVRIDAGKAAAPYVHPRLTAVEVSGKDGGPLVVQTISYADAMLASIKGGPR